MFIRFLEYIGSWVLKLLFLVGDMTLLLWEIFKQLPKKLRPKHILQQMSHLGVDTLPIVSLTLLFTGMVMTLQMAGEMIQFGAESTVGAGAGRCSNRWTGWFCHDSGNQYHEGNRADRCLALYGGKSSGLSSWPKDAGLYGYGALADSIWQFD